jgi:rhodanese-related sulfurtransferase
MSKIRPEELDDRLPGDDVFVLDIRPEELFRNGHVEGSHNVPVYHDLRSGDTDALAAKLDEIPTDREVVVVCKVGMVSRRATSFLDDEGYDATTLAGGMRGWRGYENDTLRYRVTSAIRGLLS